MKLLGLKVIADKQWKAASSFTNDAGQTFAVPANHKFVAIDENSDVINVTVLTDAPLSIKVGAMLPALQIAGTVSRSSFGWSLKAIVVNS